MKATREQLIEAALVIFAARAATIPTAELTNDAIRTHATGSLHVAFHFFSALTPDAGQSAEAGPVSTGDVNVDRDAASFAAPKSSPVKAPRRQAAT